MAELPETVGEIPEWTLGWRLRRSLEHAGISVEEMGEDMGVSRSTMSRWLNDRGAPPKQPYLRLWALRTGVPFAWLADTDPTGRGGSKIQAKAKKREVSPGFKTWLTSTLRTTAA